jgi:hypothetical protein
MVIIGEHNFTVVNVNDSDNISFTYELFKIILQVTTPYGSSQKYELSSGTDVYKAMNVLKQASYLLSQKAQIIDFNKLLN